MALDPYGYPTEEPMAPQGRWWGSALSLALFAFGFAACCMGGSLFVMAQSEEVGLDWLGVALLVSAPMWPAIGVGVATLLLYGTTRRGWTLLGPNVLTGSAAGCGLWFVLFMVVVAASVLAEGG